MWWTRFKTDTFQFGQALIDFLKLHLKREVNLERSSAPPHPSKFVERCVNVVRMAYGNGATLNFRLRRRAVPDEVNLVVGITRMYRILRLSQ